MFTINNLTGYTVTFTVGQVDIEKPNNIANGITYTTINNNDNISILVNSTEIA